MMRYDYMYIITKDEYRHLKNKEDEDEQDRQESRSNQVNNIKVSDGGTILIDTNKVNNPADAHDTSYYRDGQGYQKQSPDHKYSKERTDGKEKAKKQAEESQYARATAEEKENFVKERLRQLQGREPDDDDDRRQTRQPTDPDNDREEAPPPLVVSNMDGEEHATAAEPTPASNTAASTKRGTRKRTATDQLRDVVKVTRPNQSLNNTVEPMEVDTDDLMPQSAPTMSKKTRAKRSVRKERAEPMDVDVDEALPKTTPKTTKRRNVKRITEDLPLTVGEVKEAWTPTLPEDGPHRQYAEDEKPLTMGEVKKTWAPPSPYTIPPRGRQPLFTTTRGYKRRQMKSVDRRKASATHSDGGDIRPPTLDDDDMDMPLLRPATPPPRARSTSNRRSVKKATPPSILAKRAAMAALNPTPARPRSTKRGASDDLSENTRAIAKPGTRPLRPDLQKRAHIDETQVSNRSTKRFSTSGDGHANKREKENVDAVPRLLTKRLITPGSSRYSAKKSRPNHDTNPPPVAPVVFDQTKDRSKRLRVDPGAA